MVFFSSCFLFTHVDPIFELIDLITILLNSSIHVICYVLTINKIGLVRGVSLSLKYDEHRLTQEDTFIRELMRFMVAISMYNEMYI